MLLATALGLLSAGLLIGCSEPPAADLSVIVTDQIQASPASTSPPSLPRHLPEGETYPQDVIGFEASDGTLYPVIPAILPIPRGGSVGPINFPGKTIRVLRGKDPKAANNEALGTFAAQEDLAEVTVSFAISEDGALSLSLEDIQSKRGIPLSRSQEP